MVIGTSGRIVIEIEADTKRRLYSRLAADGLSLKSWFSEAVSIYIQEEARHQSDKDTENS